MTAPKKPKTQIPPQLALEMMGESLPDVEDAKAFILRFASAGEILTDAAVTVKDGQAPVREKKVPRATLSEWERSWPEGLWDQAAVSTGDTTYTGIRFRKEDLARVLGEHRPPPKSSPQDITKHSGRLCGQHGRAVAKVTLKWLGVSDYALLDVRVATVREELRGEYLKLKVHPPSDRNLDTIASGILLTVREKRGVNP